MNIETTKIYFDNLAENWDDLCHHDAKKIDTIVSLAQLPENSRILDIATGTGVLIPRLLEANPQEIVAIDLSSQMLAVARKKYPDPRVHFQSEDFYCFEDDSFDFAVAYSAYPHFENKSLFCDRLSACLKPGGRFYDRPQREPGNHQRPAFRSGGPQGFDRSQRCAVRKPDFFFCFQYGHCRRYCSVLYSFRNQKIKKAPA